MGSKPDPGRRLREQVEGADGAAGPAARARAGRPGERGRSKSAGPGGGSGRGGKRLDLNVPQVAGSAVAAVVAAKLASNLGVYGTIFGAGVVSVLATCGGTIFQHVFRRTGEQIRDAAGQAKPRARQVPVNENGRPVPETFRATPGPEAAWQTGGGPADGAVSRGPLGGAAPGDLSRGAAPWVSEGAAGAGSFGPAADAGAWHLPKTPTGAEPGAAPRGDDATRVLRPLAGRGRRAAADPEVARLLRKAGTRTDAPGDGATRLLRGAVVPGPPLVGEFGAATVHRARRGRSWKRPVAAAGLVFVVTMGGITTYELASGHSFSGGGNGTTIGGVVTGHHSGTEHAPEPPATPGGPPSDDGGHGPSRSPRTGAGTTPGTGEHPTPTPGTPTPDDNTPTPTPSSPTPRFTMRSPAPSPGTPTPETTAPHQ